MVDLTDSELLRTGGFVGGEWVDANSRATFDVVNPADGSVLASIADMGAEDTREAIAAADRAFGSWRARTAKERAAVLKAWHALLLEHSEDLARLMSLEMGKPIRESRGEVAYGAAFVEWFAEEGKRAYGEIVPTHDQGKRLLVLPQPVGVVAAITPWNFPLAMITRKVAPALAAGCTAVIKPPEDAPLSALAAAELARRAGVPAGVVNIVPTSDPKPVGDELASNPTVRKISFTGSVDVGKHLMRAAADTVKNVSLELGGNSPFIVFDDADIDAAVEGAIASKFRNSGQTCVCANRILVQEGVYDEFSKKLATAVEDLNVGTPVEDDTLIGPLVNGAALEKVTELVDDACAQGAHVLTGGRRHELGQTFYEATVLTDVTARMRISSEEIFGPVAPLYRFSTEEEAITMANDTPYGLASYFYAADLGRIWRVGEALESGVVAVNTGAFSSEMTPFGGIKESGIGREGSHHGLEEYLEVKYLCIGGV